MSDEIVQKEIRQHTAINEQLKNFKSHKHPMLISVQSHHNMNYIK